MRHYFVVKLFLTWFCFSALTISLWLVAQPATYLPQGLQTVERVPDDILPETMARLPQVSRDSLDAVGQQAYDTYVRPGTGYENGQRAGRDVVAQPGSGRSHIRCSPACEIRDDEGSAAYRADYSLNRARN